MFDHIQDDGGDYYNGTQDILSMHWMVVIRHWSVLEHHHHRYQSLDLYLPPTVNPGKQAVTVQQPVDIVYQS